MRVFQTNTDQPDAIVSIDYPHHCSIPFNRFYSIPCFFNSSRAMHPACLSMNFGFTMDFGSLVAFSPYNTAAASRRHRTPLSSRREAILAEMKKNHCTWRTTGRTKIEPKNKSASLNIKPHHGPTTQETIQWTYRSILQQPGFSSDSGRSERLQSF